MKCVGKLVIGSTRGRPMGALGVVVASRQEGIGVFTSDGHIYCLIYCNLSRVISHLLLYSINYLLIKVLRFLTWVL